MSYSDIMAGYEGVGNIETDPLFIDLQAGDFHPDALSPCLDAGTEEGAPGMDRDGNQRPSGSGYDMGAYEYTAYTPAVQPVISQVQPARASSGDSIQIMGSHFNEGAQIILIDEKEPDHTDEPVTYFVNSEQLTFQLPQWTKPCALVKIKAVNPDGKESNSFDFVIQGENPHLTLVTPHHGLIYGGDTIRFY